MASPPPSCARLVPRLALDDEILRNHAFYGFDIGGTKSTVSRLTADGEVVRIHRIRTTGPRETLDALMQAVDEDGMPTDVERCHGIACGGPLDSHRGLVLGPPNLPGWDRVAVTTIVEQRLRGRATLMNDANANALAEWHFGPSPRRGSLVYLTAGTGFGAGLILDGRLVEGANGGAGEIGHIRLATRGPVGYHKAGSVEGFCSGGGIARLAPFVPKRVRPADPAAWMQAHPTAESIARSARAGDATAQAVFTEAGHRLGQTIAILVDLLEPDRIVLGNLWLHCRDLLEPSMRRTLEREALPGALASCTISGSSLGESLGDHGAICAGLHRLLGRETPVTP
ncbi:ROK family transcriptional regulator [Opitutales bacterium ASA1]|uniref:ROK family protein n=1 Tax=Congregicoccus parvus TaxID=3081749 RepID=UPI002B2C61D1|nr:ROK family transcriptional regulator [Opitutales bacterium ASA1]